MQIPFVDLKAQYSNIKEEIDKAIQEVLDNTAFIKGPYVDHFEEQFGDAMGVKNTVSCGKTVSVTEQKEKKTEII